MFVGDTFIFTFFYISMACVSMSVIVLEWDGNLLRTGAVGPFLDVVPCFFLAFLVHMLCGSCMGRMCHFACGVNVIVTNFVGKWIIVFWKYILCA